MSLAREYEQRLATNPIGAIEFTIAALGAMRKRIRSGSAPSNERIVQLLYRLENAALDAGVAAREEVAKAAGKPSPAQENIARARAVTR